MAIEQVKLLEPLEVQFSNITPSTLKIGGGIAGIKAAMAIADAGYKVYLVERDLTIGGHMALFDKTFPTLDCSICFLGPLITHFASRSFSSQILFKSKSYGRRVIQINSRIYL